MAEPQSYSKEMPEKGAHPLEEQPVELAPLDEIKKGRWERSWPTIACGAGLFSDGYLNAIIGPVGTMLQKIYGDGYTNSTAQQNVSSIVFAGTVVGMLLFGYTSDHWSRKWSLMISTIILFVFAALGAGSYGAGGSLGGMLAALTAYRFFLGVGIGGEYPAGSVGAAENTGELKQGHRNRWFVMFTNFQIDFGFVVAALVSMILVLIFTEKHLHACWRVALGLGVIPPLSLMYLRLKLNEPEEFTRERMHKFPILLIIKFYWKRLAVVSIIWFLYDFSAYSFGIYSSAWLSIILGDNAPLWKSFGWSTLVNSFYIPGSALGAFMSDWIGPRYTLAIGVGLQGIIGFIMAGCYKWLATPENVAAFVVVFGIFSALGEMGPGDNIGLCAAKTSATAIRGQYYSYAAAFGKIGAFVGAYVIPVIQKNAPNPIRAGQDPFFVSSALCILAAFMAIFMLPQINQDTITFEDARFRDYLQANGYDTTTMGDRNRQTETRVQE
ncbi:Major facilitator superfamily domain general substrate transporter [Penicillium coprophilum]|uniref:Major facilitator superfamily domain general substrate transporter n=1 Tax=Penicillium coprophilum TaxID=36646 RepID=UPI0023946420|nr:Major facilitator superfamily domain general substrate transporter [Penicillium coprophilum]KAJ5164307.1 Major facilitator superfamily domain general substrate transporter [Penicillium coprophilum]